jgi:signal transduction histidine kinase/CheY-like chemotaxis protein
MPEKIIAKYALKEILEWDDSALAIADKNQKILWSNKNFKKLSGSVRVKGKNISEIFRAFDNIPPGSRKKQVSLIIPELNVKLIAQPLITNKLTDGYLLKLLKQQTDSIESDFPFSNLNFQREIQNILTLLVKETSLPKVSGEILNKCVSLSDSLFGVILFLDDKKKYSYHYEDSLNHIDNKQEAERSLQDNFTFIQKWLNLNKRSLHIKNVKGNMGYHLTEIFRCDSVIVSPCFFENNLIASLIVGKKTKSYADLEINIIEQLASLLAFAVSNIRTRELNTALENKLLQSQKLETIGKLSSGMAHDFNNLLSSIFGSLNLLKKRLPPNENIIKLVDNIENCSVRARDLTKGLLSYGKPTPKRKELIKPNILLSEMSKVITQTFPKNISFEQQIEENLYDILGSSTEIYQVLLNLCVNAKEAMEGDIRQLTLKAKNLTVNDKNQINFPLLEKGNYVCFSVKDTGSGISEEHRQKIFDPYFSTKEKDTGSGLGLYVTYGIIKAHNGHVEVSSKINEGTEFDVFIPSYEPAVVDKAASADKIILVADDEIMLRDLLAELLESNGYNVVKVISGVETLKVLTEEIKVDLAIIDYNMPEMNGLDCIREIRKLKMDFPIILSSGSLGFNGNIDLKEIGINSIINKPYEFDTMLSTIQELI